MTTTLHTHIAAEPPTLVRIAPVAEFCACCDRSIRAMRSAVTA